SGRRYRRVPLLIADNFPVKQIEGAFFIRVSLCQIGLVPGQSSLGLCQSGFKGAWVDLKKQIAFFDQTAFLIIARDDVALDLGVDIRVNETVQGRDPFEDPRHIPRRHRCDQNFRRWWTSLCRLARTSSRKNQKNQERGECGPHNQSLIAHGIDFVPNRKNKNSLSRVVRQFLQKSRIAMAISSTCVSCAKCPVSRNWTVAFGLSRRKAPLQCYTDFLATTCLTSAM